MDDKKVIEKYANASDEMLLRMLESRRNRLARIEEHCLPDFLRQTEIELIEEATIALRDRGLLA